MKKNLLLLLVIALCGISVVEPSFCMKRVRDEENEIHTPSKEQPDAKRKKIDDITGNELQEQETSGEEEGENEEEGEDEDSATGVDKMRCAQGKGFRIDETNGPDGGQTRVKPIIGYVYNNKTRTGFTFNPDGSQEQMLSGAWIDYIVPTQTGDFHYVGTTNAGLTEDDLEVECEATHQEQQTERLRLAAILQAHSQGGIPQELQNLFFN